MRLMPERQCSGCKKQVEWGCEAHSYQVWDRAGEHTRWVKPAKMPLDLLGAETYACPRQHIRENSRFWSRLLLLYGMFRKGHLPERGAILDQSAALIEMFRILDDANGDCDKEADRIEAERKARADKVAPLIARRRGRPDDA